MGLTKRAAKPYNNRMSSENSKRTKSGIAVSATGIACNLALAAAKISLGFIFGLVSVVADGFNNLSDCGGSAVSLASFKIADKPADKQHPYGHRRAEYVASMIIGCIVLFLAIELFGESINKITEGGLFGGSAAVYAVLGASIAVKSGMAVFYGVHAKKLKSDVLRAASVDSACDCLATAAVIVGLVLSDTLGLPADGWVGVAVALFILWQGIRLMIEAGSKLLGQAPDPELTDGIRKIFGDCPDVLGIHDLRIYGYGPQTYYCTVHVELDAALTSLEAHAIIDELEHKVQTELDVRICAHLDPVDLNDKDALELEKKVREALAGLIGGLELHDMRVVRGIKTKVIFDAGVPFDCPLKDGEVCALITSALSELNVLPVITVDRE